LFHSSAHVAVRRQPFAEHSISSAVTSLTRQP
jgi:hypothetical protein